MGLKIMTLALLGSAAVLSVAPAQGASLIGQTIDYCTNSVYAGAVTLDPASCDAGVVETHGTTTIVDPGIEFSLPSRDVDFTADQIIITYGATGSPSPDLYVITGITGITGISLFGGDPLGVTWTFNNNALGLLVSGLPEGPGTVVLNVSLAAGVVPEPATWGMMIGGFALAGAAMRRRKASVRFA